MAAVFGAVLQVTVPAQQAPEKAIPVAPQAARILRCPDFGRFDGATPNQGPNALARFAAILRQLPMDGAPARSLTLSPGRSARGAILAARGTPEQIDTVAGALAQLERESVGNTRLQFSMVLVPLAVARAHRLDPGKTVVTDAAAWAELLRDAVKAKGSVHNPTEVIAGALAPFVREVTATEGATDRRPLRLRGEIVPLQGDEVAIAVHVERGVAPVGEKRAPSMVAEPVFRLAAGKSAMMMALDGETALVLIVRCLETGVAEGK